MMQKFFTALTRFYGHESYVMARCRFIFLGSLRQMQPIGGKIFTESKTIMESDFFHNFSVYQLTTVLRTEDQLLVGFCDSLRTEGYHPNDPMQRACIERCKANYASCDKKDEMPIIYTTMAAKEASLCDALGRMG
jgi:hypothetical protein